MAVMRELAERLAGYGRIGVENGGKRYIRGVLLAAHGAFERKRNGAVSGSVDMVHEHGVEPVFTRPCLRIAVGGALLHLFEEKRGHFLFKIGVDRGKVDGVCNGGLAETHFSFGVRRESELTKHGAISLF